MVWNIWNQQFTHSLSVWCKQVQGLLRQAHTTSCNRARPVECVVWVIGKCSINLSATWFSDNMCVCVCMCVCHENSSSCLLCFTACFTTCSANLSFPLEFILSSVSSKGERADQDDWRSTSGAFEGGAVFLVVAEVKRSIETCRLKQSWVFNQREDHWTNLLKYWRHVGLRPWWFCRYEFRPQHHCIWFVCWPLKA